MLEFLTILASKLTGVWPNLLVSTLLMIAISSALCLFSSQACNPGRATGCARSPTRRHW